MNQAASHQAQFHYKNEVAVLFVPRPMSFGDTADVMEFQISPTGPSSTAWVRAWKSEEVPLREAPSECPERKKQTHEKQMLFLQKVSNRIRGELQVCLLDIDSFPVCVYFSINILVASSGLKAQTCISEYPLPGEFSNLGGAPTSFLDFPIWNMGAKAPILYTTLVNLVSHFSFVYFELKNAQWKLCELFFFFFGFLSVTHLNGRYL